MLYEIFADGESKLFFMTNRPFNAKEARKLLPNASSVAIKPVREFYYDTSSFISLDEVTHETVGVVIKALIKKEIKDVAGNN